MIKDVVLEEHYKRRLKQTSDFSFRAGTKTGIIITMESILQLYGQNPNASLDDIQEVVANLLDSMEPALEVDLLTNASANDASKVIEETPSKLSNGANVFEFVKK